MILKQWQPLLHREFKIVGETLLIKTKYFGEHKEWSVRIEDLGERKYYVSTTKFAVNIIASIFAVFTLFLTIDYFQEKGWKDEIILFSVCFILLSSIVTFLILLPRKNELNLNGGVSQVCFTADKPSKKEVEDFVDQLILLSKQILINKYGKIDSDLPEAIQINQLNWLKNRGVISQEKYEKLKREYKMKKIIGLGFYTSNN